jgi:hypothetical protein
MSVKGRILLISLLGKKTPRTWIRTCKLFHQRTTMRDLSLKRRIHSWLSRKSHYRQCLQPLGCVRKNSDIHPNEIPRIIYPCGSPRISPANWLRYRKMTSCWALLVHSCHASGPPTPEWPLRRGTSLNGLAFRTPQIPVLTQTRALLNWLESRR